MGYTEGFFLVLGVFVGVVGIALVRYLVLRRIRRQLATGLIEEMNALNGQIRRLNERLGQLTRSIESRAQTGTAANPVELAETLTEMNRLLHEIHDIFAREEAAALEGSDFLTPEEAERFRRMRDISSDDLRRANWDEILDRLREEKK